MSFEQSAEETKEWDRFWCSGKVEDYLRFRNCCGREGKPEEAAYCGDVHREFMDERDRFC